MGTAPNWVLPDINKKKKKDVRKHKSVQNMNLTRISKDSEDFKQTIVYALQDLPALQSNHGSKSNPRMRQAEYQ